MWLVLLPPDFQLLRLLEKHRFRKHNEKCNFNAFWVVGEQLSGFYFLKKMGTKNFFAVILCFYSL
jgi:hypothetical protein